MLVSRHKIEDFARQIGKEFNPERVILFGSYAYGRPTSASDVDILVVMNHQGQSVRKACEILQKIDTNLPIDIIVKSPQALKERIEMNDFFLQEITSKGKVLYETPHA